ncbi:MULTISPECIES: aerolysin family beta-barrel pore-forming toxin [unclassified Salinivibrio]|uniref:aerolysin family beta-barrel pore-forming toxin n=1 Tax=unclassified Salinivibrio TaxID=2636825 RepID=UPI00128BB55C|nr:MULTISPECIES: aerolysin family beta-barrel pore-forming toxin [unclassified Salinivibrio]MPS33108.1 aerolysin family beta-barrel pore-forming toxin [Salinivibrio sp. VYel7]MPX91497.1 aerolysin family beta-barrel pore-forming toxin [Salinivibrio sp. VYel1]MPX94494.1 aerolysin family beta-barrel pore-forming toxin [Salinivibrio sp. VYel9]MPX95124.1 aerolysin family beta-barrel pore-forming toxin [Salinivibrio sp. VYel6]MPY00755.1 aerolysin family beta-barrel pore-forming toxin [Salinivibrio s
MANTIRVTALTVSSLSVLVYAGLAQANIYPDQIVLDNLGDDQCRANYRPLTADEASTHRHFLMDRMGQWQISGLAGDWAIMGSGYNGEIKQYGQTADTWCYPENDEGEIPHYAAKSIPEGTELDIQYALVNNRSEFVKPLSYLAHYLGYAWVGGNHSDYVGEDMDVWRSGDKWHIRGNNDGGCDGYRCSDKTTITVDNFAYTLNDSDFWHGDVVESDRQLVKTVSAVARNNTDIDQQVVVDLKVDESTSWEKTNTYGFSQKVETENSFDWPLVGETKLTISFEANQSFASSNGGASSEQVTLQARPFVPAHSEIPIRVELYRSSISYPYRFGADISYDVNFNGFLRWGGNAWHSHPDNRPTHDHTFTMGRSSQPSADIAYQWHHRYIPGEVKWWDWSWAIEKYGLQSMQWATGKSLRPFYSHVSGDFYAESQYAGTIEVGQAKSFTSHHATRSKRSAPFMASHDRVNGVELISNFDSDELAALGFENAELTIKPAQ